LGLRELLGLKAAVRPGDRTPSLGGRAPAVPEGVRIYAIGDVHGRLDLLRDLERRIADDLAEAAPAGAVYLVHLGDYVDRGPESCGVLEHLCRAALPGTQRVLLRGNHDHWLAEFALRGRLDESWLAHGGDATLASYGAAPEPGLPVRFQAPALHRRLTGAMPPEHRRLLARLQAMLTLGDYVFCHAGVHPARAIDAQLEDDLLWIREPFLSFNGLLPKVVVHGHTVVEAPDLRRHRIGIDTGACWTGRLTAVVLEGTAHRFLWTGAPG
jgi:serine/threonine protein phosphatase 1